MLQAEFALDARPDRIDGHVDPDPPSAAECRARASLYRLLAGVFAEEPSRPFLAALRGPELLAQLAEAGVCFGQDFLQPELAPLHDTLGCEYATLFAASGGFPPVESVRLTGRYMQDPAFQTAARYQRMGFAAAKGRFDIFADHLGVELSFVAALLERRAKAIEANQPALQLELDRELRRFWTLHLGRWVRGYARLIERAAEHSFYRAMAGLLAGFADEEIAAMGLRRLQDLDQARVVVPKAEAPFDSDPALPVCGACPGASQRAAMVAGPAGSHPTLNDLRIVPPC